MPSKLTHGCYGWSTYFNIIQHKYVGGEGGFCEMLEIEDPPDGRCGFVINQYGRGAGYKVWEYPTLEDVMVVWPSTFPPIQDVDLMSQGNCIRDLDWSGASMAPWFYARVEEEVPEGDFFELPAA